MEHSAEAISTVGKLQRTQKAKKRPKLRIVETSISEVKKETTTNKHVVNKGTGAGGSNTNKNGLQFEQVTELNQYYTILEIKDKNTKFIKFNDCDRDTVFVYTKKNGFNTYLGDKIKKEPPALHGTKQPDEVYIDEKNRNIFIVEKKFQQGGGSKCECLQTPDKKKRNISRRIPGYEIIYIYCLSEWFKKNCPGEIMDFEEDKIPYFWGSSENYKDDVINFIINYK